VDIKPHTLVLYTGQQDLTGGPIWGIVKARCGENHYNVTVPPIQIRPGVEQAFVIAHENDMFLTPIIDGRAKNPDKVARKHSARLMAVLFGAAKDVLTAERHARSFQMWDLVLVLPENGRSDEGAWGLVKKIMPGGKIMVVVGERRLRVLRPITRLVPPEKLILASHTDGKTASPRRAFFRNVQTVTMQAYLALFNIQNRQSKPES